MLGKELAEISAPYPCPVPDGEVRSTLRELLGVKDPPQSIEYSTKEEATEEGMRIQHVEFANMLGETVPGVLIVPSQNEAGELPAVVCMSGTCGDALRLTDERFRPDDTELRPLRGWARELARRGFVTLSVTVRMNDARRLSDGEWLQEMKSLAPYGISEMGLLVDEALRGARMLANHEEVDSARIGLTGMSMGGNTTWHACEERVLMVYWMVKRSRMSGAGSRRPCSKAYASGPCAKPSAGVHLRRCVPQRP